MEIPARIDIDKRLNCLIEDYKAIKSEISRRSELQRFALVTYGGVIVLSLKFSQELHFYLNQILLIWLTSSIAYLFYISEDDFITKLAKIANFNSKFFNHLLKESNKDNGLLEQPLEFLQLEFKPYSKSIIEKTENITLGDIIFPSESSSVYEIVDTKQEQEVSKTLNASFLFIYFLILPAILTYLYIVQSQKEICCTFDIGSLVIISICLATNIFLHIYLHTRKNLDHLGYFISISVLLLLPGLFIFSCL